MEDAEDDAQLALRELRLAGLVCVGARVQTDRELVEALHAFAPDVVLSDHALPQFSAQDALRTVQRVRPETPVIVVTGSLDEETAAAYIKSGAADYIVKHRLHRLGPAVRRAVALRRAQQEAVEAAQAKARSEQRFRKLVEFSSDVITLLDRSGTILYSSQSINPTLGYEHGELTGHRVFELVHEEDRRRAEQLFRDVARGTRPGRADLRVRHKSGPWRELEVVAANHLNDPDVGAIVVTYHDVTDRKEAEEQVRRTTEFLTHAQTLAHIGSWEWDRTADAVTWSEETHAIFGLVRSPGPISFAQYLDLIHPGDRDAVAAAFQHALGSSGSFEFDHRVLHPDGSEHDLHNRGGLVTNAAGQAVRVIGSVLDITARKKTEVALREANAHLATVIESSPLAIASIDADDTVWTWNGAAERQFGWPAAEVLGRRLPIVAVAQQDAYAGLRHRVLRGESLHGVELACQRRDGTTATVNWSVAPLRDIEGRAGVLAILEDVTTLKRLEQQFLAAQKMEAIGRLAGGVAHDFNNLLTVILASTDLLLETLSPDHPGRDEAQETREAALRAADLTRQLLAFSRQQVLAPRVLDLNEIVSRLNKMLQRLIGEDVDLQTALARDLAPVRADPGQIEQVILNLAVNARDAMPTGGRLTIETTNVELAASAAAEREEPAGPYVVLAVSDTGIGMDADTQARMFEPFFTTKPKGKGTGLGLATVYGIVKQSGGHAAVASEPGRGTSVKIFLPRVDADLEPETSQHPATGSLRGSETLLLVEDQEQLRTLTRRMLESYGYHVLAAASGAEALRIAEQYTEPIHLLVTDVVMPGMSGLEVSLLLAPIRPMMRVLYVSGYPDESVVQQGILTPGTPFLQKPFTRLALAQTVRNVLDAGWADGGEQTA